MLVNAARHHHPGGWIRATLRLVDNEYYRVSKDLLAAKKMDQAYSHFFDTWQFRLASATDTPHHEND